MVAMDQLELGLGLVSIGRRWGVGKVSPPSESQARKLLSTALDVGIKTFDTAPAYAASEAILGRFFGELPASDRQELFVMTKAGEQWDEESGNTIVDHSLDALKRSIDRSLSLLGPIALLQIHKAAEHIVGSSEVRRAIDYAREAGISRFGASISTVEAGRRAIETGAYSYLQFPFNESDQTFLILLPDMVRSNIRPVINRPFAMGALVQPGARWDAARVAFAFVSGHVDNGIVLTGTSKPDHLLENVANFLQCRP